MADTLSFLESLGLFEDNGTQQNPPEKADFSFSEAEKPEFDEEAFLQEIQQGLTEETPEEPTLTPPKKLQKTQAKSQKALPKAKPIVEEIIPPGSKREQIHREFKERHPFRPTINTKSSKIIEKALKSGKDPRNKPKKPQEESPKKPNKVIDLNEFLDRNYKEALDKLKTKKSTVKDPEEHHLKECTFTPKLDERSKKLKKDYKEDLFKLAAKRKQERQQKVESKLKEEFANELNGCTFRPSILRTFDLSPKVERPTMTPPKRYSTSITRLSPVSSFAAKLNAEESQEPK